ncbi:MAG: hypothetical protein NUW06_06730 [Candidatus Acetothermia bacterium]|jgi:hypothetical protein|nr:hypothetical protein [Candidatus Acetothermia bacterium]MDH7505426.1 hypothetical protein [Candidatus Acetothermia bacterium]
MRPKAALIALLLLLQVGAGSAASGELLTYLADATGWNNAQKIVVSADGTIHIVYQQRLGSGTEQDLFAYARSRDGQNWEIASCKGRWPAIALELASDEIYIAFVRRLAERDELRLRRMAQDGGTELLLTSSAPGSLLFPAVAVAAGRVHLAWEAHLGGRSSIAHAELELASQQLMIETVAEGDRGLYFPSLAVGPDGVHLVWEEEVDGLRHRIVHAWRESSRWQVDAIPEEGELLNAHYPALDYHPDLRVYELVFARYDAAGNAIYYRALGARGWSEPECLSCWLESGYWSFPTVEDGNVVWGRQVAAGCPEGPLFYSHLSGRSWSEPQALEGDFAAFPHLFRLGDKLYLVWTDRDVQSPILRLVRYRQLQISQGSP